MSRIKFTTNIDEELLNKAKEKADAEGLEGANIVIETALKIYFANCNSEVWEKKQQGGWIKKLVVRPSRVTFESIRSRNVNKNFNPQHFTKEALENRGWKMVWKCCTPENKRV